MLPFFSFFTEHTIFEMIALAVIKGQSISVNVYPNCGINQSWWTSGHRGRTAYLTIFLENPAIYLFGTVS